MSRTDRGSGPIKRVAFHSWGAIEIFLLLWLLTSPLNVTAETNAKPRFQTQTAVAKLVSEFPPIPQHPRAVIQYSHKKTEGDLVGYEANLATPASVSEVIVFYQKEFLRLGWELIKPLQDPQSVEQSITLQKGITVLRHGTDINR